MDRSCKLMHGQPRQPFNWNYFPLLTGRIVLSNKKANLRKYSAVVFKAISKKKFDLVLSWYTNWLLSHKYDGLSTTVVFEKWCMYFNFWLRIVWLAVSNALEWSSKTKTDVICYPALIVTLLKHKLEQKCSCD